MYSRLLATKAANIARKQQQDLHRRTDPFELARSYLQQRGYTVFAARVLSGPEGMFVVGRRLLTPEEVIGMADAMRERGRVEA